MIGSAFRLISHASKAASRASKAAPHVAGHAHKAAPVIKTAVRAPYGATKPLWVNSGKIAVRRKVPPGI